MTRHPWLIGATPFAFLAALFIAAGQWWSGLGVLGFLVVCGSVGAAFVRAEENVRLREELDRVKREHKACPPSSKVAQVPLISFDTLSRAERAHIADNASPTTAASLRPSLHVVEPVTEDAPEADETWLDESPLFRDGDGRWV